MVSNAERIYAEIKKESENVAAEHNLSPDTLTELVMDLVDLEDRNLSKKIPINQEFENRLRNSALYGFDHSEEQSC